MAKRIKSVRGARNTGLRLENTNAQKHDIRAEGEAIFVPLRAGDYFKVACRNAGVNVRTAERWFALGKNSLGYVARDGHLCREEHVWFYEECVRAMAEIEGRVVDAWIREIEKGNWQAARDFLARRFPKRWGNNARRQLHVRSEGDTDIQLVWGDEDRDRYEGERAQSGEPHVQNPFEQMAAEEGSSAAPKAEPGTFDIASAPGSPMPADCAPFPAVPAVDPLERCMVRGQHRPESLPRTVAEELLDRRLSLSFLAGNRARDGGWFRQLG